MKQSLIIAAVSLPFIISAQAQSYSDPVMPRWMQQERMYEQQRQQEDMQRQIEDQRHEQRRLEDDMRAQQLKDSIERAHRR